MRMRLADLLRRLLAETEIERLRLSSVEPMDLSDGLLELMASSPRIARHVHAPLQTGSDAGAAADAAVVPGQALRGPRPEGACVDAGGGHRGRRDGGLSGRDARPSSRRAARFHREPRRSPTCTSSPTRSGRERPPRRCPGQVPVRERKQRNRVLRESGRGEKPGVPPEHDRKAPLGGDVSTGGVALSSNYLKVELARPREPNRLIEVEIGGVTAQGVREELPPPQDFNTVRHRATSIFGR